MQCIRYTEDQIEAKLQRALKLIKSHIPLTEEEAFGSPDHEGTKRSLELHTAVQLVVDVARHYGHCER